MAVPGPWHERLPHFRWGFTPSAGKELQSEYLLPRRNAVGAILAVESLRDQVTPHLLISEIRTIAADDLWMSTCYRQPATQGKVANREVGGGVGDAISVSTTANDRAGAGVFRDARATVDNRAVRIVRKMLDKSKVVCGPEVYCDLVLVGLQDRVRDR